MSISHRLKKVAPQQERTQLKGRVVRVSAQAVALLQGNCALTGPHGVSETAN